MQGRGAAAGTEHQAAFSKGHSPKLAPAVFLSLGADPLPPVALVYIGPLPFPTRECCDVGHPTMPSVPGHCVIWGLGMQPDADQSESHSGSCRSYWTSRGSFWRACEVGGPARLVRSQREGTLGCRGPMRGLRLRPKVTRGREGKLPDGARRAGRNTQSFLLRRKCPSHAHGEPAGLPPKLRPSASR